MLKYRYMILGIDEVGRGPWAGPLVVGAVVLGGAEIEGLTDSKKLTKKRRDVLDIEIREKAVGFGLGWVEASELDEIGLSTALVMATRRAVEQINVPYHEIIIDGTVNFLAGTSKGQYVTTLKKADLLIPSVSAASIIAKVARDNFMELQDEIYPGYGFSRHVGYGTAVHRAAIEELGVTPLHRLSFAPLKKYSNQVKDVVLEKPIPITTKMIGDSAEDVAAKYLIKNGHEILNRNWRTKYCEIDIVSKLDDIIYFTEVKYRKKPDQGGGLAAITKTKLRQMKFAAEYYALSNNISDTNMRLAAITVSGQPPNVELFIEA
ncbi:ribonuclease HII [Candidatus Saccharibacteria bacterium HGW-Saccharibacteria-1]|nr:MAG: ribonuclease HII [Candidatus Saccharibacteria bacterium HGW-Saccharibacteria-1]